MQEHSCIAVASAGSAVTARCGDVQRGVVDAPYDVVLPAVKAAGLEQAVDDMAAAVGSHSLVVPVLDGVRDVDVLAARVGDQDVLGGVAKVATTLDAQGDIVHLTPLLGLRYGARRGAVCSAVPGLRPAVRRQAARPRLFPAGRRAPGKWSTSAPPSPPRPATPTRVGHRSDRPEDGLSQPFCDRRCLAGTVRVSRCTVATTASPGQFPSSPTAPYHTGPGLSRSG
ncbi:ketopantoate reductase family protein [Streptomyces mirabilis]|uniref:ketopantoate reductase family protein n=1 Tax=Streptomyces mirabilis TaxID=68239 RepID=UPI0036A00666